MLAAYFSGDLHRWQPDRDGVWSLSHGMLRGELPDRKQERSVIYAGLEAWRDYAVDLDACMMRGVDKGVVVRAAGKNRTGGDPARGTTQDATRARGQGGRRADSKPERRTRVGPAGSGYRPVRKQHARRLANPLEAPIVGADIGEDLDKGGWRLVEDNQIARGGCKIDTASNQIDAPAASRWPMWPRPRA